MFEFKTKKEAVKEDKPSGKSFLTEAKRQHQELFDTFADQADEYDGVEEYTDALQAQAWELTELIAKSSYKNGVARGRSGNRHGRS
jgi:beta-phosphoglucomutase-like phosphatase (HAD superfamily)